MEILKDIKIDILYLSQKGYIGKVFQMFNMLDTKAVSIPLAAHFKLLSRLCPQSNEDIDYMTQVPYSNAVDLLMYIMVCTRLDLAYAVRAVSRHMTNPSKEH